MGLLRSTILKIICERLRKGLKHLQRVWGDAERGHLTGLLHDLGKYSYAFQSYISHKSGADPKAYIENDAGPLNRSREQNHEFG